jgi:hypothetical protein
MKHHLDWPGRRARRSRWPVALLLAALAVGVSCDAWRAEQPPYYEIFAVHGTPYERGYQHGAHFASKIRSLYTTLLETSIFPYLNREQPDVASVLMRYQDERYQDGQFSYLIMLESALSLAETMPAPYLEEMHGIADGADLPFEQVLILNTFFDTLMAFRSITAYIKLIQAPFLVSVEFVGDLDQDGRDNDGDGEIDEPRECRFDPYEPLPHATCVEVPPGATIRLVIDDDLEGVDPESVRLQFDDTLYLAGDAALAITPIARDGRTIEVLFTPPDGLAPGEVHSLILQAGDLNRIIDPPPLHARFMRDERVTFTTRGYGALPFQVANRGLPDGRTQPPSIGFAAADEATADGRLLVAHHFAMLDGNASHKHTVLFVHHPDDGKPYAYVGWAGLIWGTSGINADGLTYLFTASDTLDSPFADAFNQGLIFAELIATGIPIGIMGREVLRGATSVHTAVAYLRQVPPTFGWNLLVADRERHLAVVERDANILNEANGGAFTFSGDANDPGDLDEWGRPFGSIGPGELHFASHFQRNTEDIAYQVLEFEVRPQRYWSTFYFRSLRAFFNLSRALADRYGRLDADEAIRVLRLENLVDHRDSMNAVVYEPERMRLHFAMGREPATDGAFIPVDLRQAFRLEDEP